MHGGMLVVTEGGGQGVVTRPRVVRDLQQGESVTMTEVKGGAG